MEQQDITAQKINGVQLFAAICTGLAVTISGYQILMHLFNYNEKQVQLQVIRILTMIPVFSFATLCSIEFPEHTLTFNTLRDIYEAYVLYIFMQLLVQFLGGENQLIVHLEFKRRVRQPWPFHQIPIQTDKIFYRRVKQGVLQFVMIKPFTAFAAILLDHMGLYHDGQFNLHSGYFWIAGINNFSISLSLYCLVLFYMATEERLAPFDPFYKFLTVKAILFFSFWQASLFQILHHFDVMERETGNMALNLITCAEMVAIAYAQSQAFTWRQFRGLQPSSSRNSRNKKKEWCCINAIKAILQTKDVLEDARNTFINIQEEEERERETQLDELMRGGRAFQMTEDDEMALSKQAKEQENYAVQTSETQRKKQQRKQLEDQNSKKQKDKNGKRKKKDSDYDHNSEYGDIQEQMMVDAVVSDLEMENSIEIKFDGDRSSMDAMLKMDKDQSLGDISEVNMEQGSARQRMY